MHKLSFTAKFVLLNIVVLLLASGCARPTQEALSSEQESATISTERPRRLRDGIQTFLVTCLDTFEVPQNSETYRNGNKADFIMVMILDEAQGSVTALQLNPDTMVHFSVPGMSETLELPLGLVCSYGSGGSDSCLNMKKAVTGLLGGISMDYYMAFTADSLVTVNDMVGGVTIPVSEQFPGQDSLLLGEQVKDFFCFREETDVSNEVHMGHQQQYIAELYQPFVENTQNENFLTKLTVALGDGFLTDLTLTQMTQLLQSMEGLTLDETIVTIPGEAIRTDGQFRFHVDTDALDRTVNSLFCS